MIKDKCIVSYKSAISLVDAFVTAVDLILIIALVRLKL